jgi:ParB-like chromosome segregation protein Spo0J
MRKLGWSQIAAVVRTADEDQAYLLTLTENLQREDLKPSEEAAALKVLVMERGMSGEAVAKAINRSRNYVSRRLRVFDDPVLTPMVLDDKRPLPVTTAEELLRVDDANLKQQLAEQAIEEQWTPRVARREVDANRNGALQQPLSRLAGRLRALADELADIEAASLSPREKREVRHLAGVLSRLA